jgi:hypothetical protein
MEKIYKRKTNEVKVTVKYESDENGTCAIAVIGKGDFRHHLIEEVLFLIADEFDMGNHLQIVINKLQVRLDNANTMPSV